MDIEYDINRDWQEEVDIMEEAFRLGHNEEGDEEKLAQYIAHRDRTHSEPATTSTWIDAVDGWVKQAKEDAKDNTTIEMTFDNGVYRQIVGMNMQHRPDYFLGMRDTIAEYIEHRIKSSFSGFDVQWIPSVEDADGDIDEAECGIFRISTNNARADFEQDNTENFNEFVAGMVIDVATKMGWKEGGDNIVDDYVAAQLFLAELFKDAGSGPTVQDMMAENKKKAA